MSLLAIALGVTATVVASPPLTRSLDTPGTTARANDAVKHRWFQVGKASWYGGKFQGRKTANGERFDMNAMTCAHRDLPMGTWVRVTNLRNQKVVFLRVNDRGPVPENIIMDLSYAGAKALGVTGLAKVKIEEVKANDPVMKQELLASLPPADKPLWLAGIGR